MDLNVPVTHTKIHCKVKSYKNKVYLTYRPIKVRMENTYVGTLEAVFDSGSMVHAIFGRSVQFFYFSVSCFELIRLKKEPRDFPGKILVGLLGSKHDGSKYHKSITDNRDIWKLIIPAFASIFQFLPYNSD